MANLTQDFINELVQPIVDVYTQLENDLIVNIARRFNSDKGLATTEWQIKKLAEMGQLTKENLQIIANAVAQVPELTQIALESAAWESLKLVEPMFADAVKAGYINGAKQSISDSIAQALKAYQDQAQEAYNLVNTTMLKSSVSVYNKTVNGIALTERQAETAQGVLNKATGGVATGIESRTTALRKALTELANAGITGYTDKAGRNWSPEAYVNMDICTTVNNVANQCVLNRAEDYDSDIFEFSSHAGARPKCAIDQGKFVSIKGRSGVVSDVYGNQYSYIPIGHTSYGEPDGILGINCGHHWSPVIPGHFVKRSEETKDFAANDKQYKESQQQRKLERTVRKDKTALKALQASDVGCGQAATKLRSDTNKLKQYCEYTGRTYRPDRIQVDGFTKAQAQSVIQASRQNLDKIRASVYNSNRLMPNALTAATPESKVKDYLLNLNNKDGAGKARVIRSALGYTQDDWQTLSNKIYAAIQTTPYSSVRQTKYGVKYTVPVDMTNDTGGVLNLNTVWQVDNGSNIPRLITATPGKKKGGKG